MKQFKSHFYLLCYLLFCVACARDDGKIEFTFLQVNDVYEIAPIQGGQYGGMARVENVHQDLLKENKNTLLLMAGDFLNPSLLGTLKYQGERIKGRQMIEVMNAMNFDLVAFGNHEFDLSESDLQKRLNESNFPWMSSNVFYKRNDTISLFYKEREGKKEFVNDTYIKEFTDQDGTKVKVGFLSVCIPSNPKSYVKYTPIFEEAQRAYNLLKDEVDIVFGLTHLTLDQDRRVLEMLPQVPLIMGGHEHTNMKIAVGDSFITKADANAKTVYIHRVSFDAKTKEFGISSTLKEINETVKSDVKVGAVVNQWQEVLKSKIKEVIANPDKIIYTTEIPLEARDTPIRSAQTNMGNLITKAMSFAYDDAVDCALVNGGSIRIDDVLEGAISPVDIFRVLPYGGPILKVKMKGSLLKKVLHFGENAAGTGAYLQRFNISFKNDDWYVSDKKIRSSQIYTVAFSDYLLKGFDIPFLSAKNEEILSVYRPKLTEKAADIRKSVILYLEFMSVND